MSLLERNTEDTHDFIHEVGDDTGKVDQDYEYLVWKRFSQGSQRSLIYIFQNYSQLLFNYGYQFSKDRELVKDCLQDTFLDLIKYRQSISTTTSVKFYLMKCLRNKLLNELKTHKKREIAQKESQKDDSFQISISSEVRILGGQMNYESNNLLQNKINELAPLQREAIMLFFYEGLKYAEIAELLGIKVKSARALIYRSLDSLKSKLSPFRGSILLSMFCVFLLM